MNQKNYEAKSIRTFIGAKNYEESKQFYRELGFEEIDIDLKMVYFKVNENLGFYLQDYYVKDWVNNSMIFLEIEDLEACWNDINDRNLPSRYNYVRLTEIKDFDWGQEFFLHDPSGVLWHFGMFK